MHTSVVDSPEQAAVQSESSGKLCDADIAPTGHIGFRIPTRLELIGRAADYICRQAQSLNICDEERAGKLSVALHEALTNAMVHGNLGISSRLKEQPDNAFSRTLASRSADPSLADRLVCVDLEITRSTCEITITDDGAGFDTAQMSPSDHEEEPNGAEVLLSGRGILMMRAFTDGVRFAQGGRQAILTLINRAHDERRSETRIGSGQKVRVFPLADPNSDDSEAAVAQEGSGLAACVANISKDGAALVLASRLRSAHRILIDASDGGEPLAAEVCRVTPVGDGIVQIGCRFISPREGMFAVEGEIPAATCLPAAIASVIETLARRDHVADERRSDNRYLYSVRIGIRTAGPGPAIEAFSRDLSRRGLALIASTQFATGHRVLVTLPGPSGEPLPSVPAKVVRCQRVTSGVYDIGCEFIDASAA